MKPKTVKTMTMAAAVAATCLLAGVARGVVTVTPETKWSYSGATPGVFTDAFTNDVDASYLFREYAARRQIVVGGIRDIPALSLGGVDAAFYAFVNISATGKDSQTFAYGLLKEQRVAVVPGLAYGDAYDSFIRIAFTVHGDRLREALKRIRAFVGDVGFVEG